MGNAPTPNIPSRDSKRRNDRLLRLSCKHGWKLRNLAHKIFQNFLHRPHHGFWPRNGNSGVNRRSWTRPLTL